MEDQGCIHTTCFASTEGCWQLWILPLCSGDWAYINKSFLNGQRMARPLLCLNPVKQCNETALQVLTCRTLQVSSQQGNGLWMSVCTKLSCYSVSSRSSSNTFKRMYWEEVHTFKTRESLFLWSLQVAGMHSISRRAQYILPLFNQGSGMQIFARSRSPF